MGVSTNADEREITKAYRELVSRYHPDKHQNNELKDLAEEKLAELNEAYEILSDPVRRADYDEERRRTGFSSPEQPPARRSSSAQIPLSRLIGLLVFALVSFVILKFFVRSPRMGAILGAILAIIWFGPRVYAFFKSKTK